MNIMKVNLHIKMEPLLFQSHFEKEDDGSYEKDYDVDVEPKYSRMRPGIDEEPDDKIPLKMMRILRKKKISVKHLITRIIKN